MLMSRANKHLLWDPGVLTLSLSLNVIIFLSNFKLSYNIMD